MRAGTRLAVAERGAARALLRGDSVVAVLPLLDAVAEVNAARGFAALRRPAASGRT